MLTVADKELTELVKTNNPKQNKTNLYIVR
jgi:hypothetical protein